MNRVSLLLLLALVLAPTSAAAGFLYVNPDGLCGGNLPCYVDLASAVAASSAGDVIMVQPGLYAVTATIVVDRSLTILGPQNGMNPLPSKGTTRVPGDPMTEAIFDGQGTVGTIIRITASDVAIDGIEVRNGTSDLIASPANLPLSGTTLRNCIVHAAIGDEGIQLRDQAGAVIECNHVFDTAGDGINLCCGSSGGLIQNNEIHDIASPDAAIYVYNSTDTRIEGNLVYNTTHNEGIKLGAKYGPDAALTGGIVANNTIHHTAQDGIALYSSNSTVECNEVHHSASENGGIYVAYAVHDNVIEDNYVHDNVFNTAKWGDPAGIMIGVEVDAGTTVVRNNRIEGNLPNGVTNQAGAMLTAQANWWGDASGPGGAGPGSGDAVSANVDYSSWLAAPPTPSCPPIGTCAETPTPTLKRSWGQIKMLYR